ncbi:MAG TPA: adenine phosphoribosyltransferase [Gemmatimonadaceae bacterium]|nr:adenine phosphoribosyltransferase [Gemmatimonadaceae bacterium]
MAAADLSARLTRALRDVPDFPRPGIVFKDITPVLADASLFAETTAAMAAAARALGVTHVAGIESRGFIFAAPIALALGAGFIPIRKPGKLPWRSVGREYALEYGSDRLEMHVDALPRGARVLLVDDVLATGGTAAAAAALIEEVDGSVVACSFLLAIGALQGAERLRAWPVQVLLAV